MPQEIVIEGVCDPAFRAVRDAFAENFSRRNELGAAVSVRVGGEPVVHLWGGFRDPGRTRQWTANTAVVGFSTTKGVVATVFQMLADRGVIELGRPVAGYWPEFAQNGKAQITVAQLLEHRSGLSWIPEAMKVEQFADADAVEDVLARQPTCWPPGTRQGYGATMFGAYAGALFRRVTGESLGSFVARELRQRHRLDLWLGEPRGTADRRATLVPVPAARRVLRVLPSIITGRTVEGRLGRGVLNRRSATHRAFFNPVMGGDPVARFNDADVLALELPWANLVTTADALATLYSHLANGGGKLISGDGLREVYRRRSFEYDAVLRKPLGFSLGFLKEETHLFSPHVESFGHPGIGGALGWADPVTKVSIGYVMNRMDHRLRSPRALAICHAVWRSLGIEAPERGA